MSALLGRTATIRLGTDAPGSEIKGLQSWSTDAPETIDVTVAGDTHRKSAVGLLSGQITAELIVDSDDTALVTAVTNGFAGTPTNCYFRIDGESSEPDIAWSALVMSSLSTGGPADAAKRTLTFHRQSSLTIGS